MVQLQSLNSNVSLEEAGGNTAVHLGDLQSVAAVMMLPASWNNDHVCLPEREYALDCDYLRAPRTVDVHHAFQMRQSVVASPPPSFHLAERHFFPTRLNASRSAARRFIESEPCSTLLRVIKLRSFCHQIMQFAEKYCYSGAKPCEGFLCCACCLARDLLSCPFLSFQRSPSLTYLSYLNMTVK